MDGWLKTRRNRTGYKRVTTSDGTFLSGGTEIMSVDEVSFIVIVIGQESWNLGSWSWMLLRGKKNVITRIITTYFPTVGAITGGAYSRKLESLTMMKIQNDPRTQFWIDLNTEILKWIHQGEQIILIGDWNSEASEVNTWMET